MLKYFRVPLVFLFLGSLLGVFLRWQFISPTPGTNYSFFLHAHSHVMFLGWIFNALYIALCNSHISEVDIKGFRNLFIILQVTVVGMLVTFPIQGYAFYSILFSTLHTIFVLVFVVKFFISTKHITSLSAWCARTALIFFAVSTAGPFSLGYLMANGLGQSDWYFFSIYFYLHFQYNGFFLFGIFSLFFDLLDRKQILFDQQKARNFGWIIAVACVPTYLLSVLWAKPGLAYNIVAGVAALVQLFALYILIELLLEINPHINRTFRKRSVYFLAVVLIAFAIKLLLQAISSFPDVAQMAYQLRPVVIAYLHLVLIGIVSLALFIWYIEFNLFDRYGPAIVLFFLVSFVGMELCLIFSPWWNAVFQAAPFTANQMLLLFASMLSVSSLLLLFSASNRKHDKSQALS